MTVNTTSNKIRFDGNGSTTSFDTDFTFFESDELVVIYTDADGVDTTWTEGSDYTVTGGNGSTGTVVATTAPASSTTLTILRSLDPLQELDLLRQGAWDPSEVEEALDKIVMMVQQVIELNSRALVTAATDVAPASEIPNAASRANKYLQFDANGDPTAATAVTAGALTVSSFIETLLDDTDKATARATLDAQEVLTALLTTSGDLLYNNAGTLSRLAIGSAGQQLEVSGGLPSWQTPASSSIPTGAIISSMGSTLSGWLELDGDTIGSATSGATHADAGNENLFTHLWDNVGASEIAIYTSGGTPTSRGASAAADWAADKRLALPDARGRVLMHIDAGGLAQTSTGADTIGAQFGDEDNTIAEANLPSHNHTITGGSHSHTFTMYPNADATAAVPLGGIAVGGTGTGTTSSTSHSHTAGNTGSGTALTVAPPQLVVRWFIKQ